MNKKCGLYLDDIRVPYDPKYIVVKTHEELVKKVNEIGLENFDVISLDHDLGIEAVREYYRYDDSIENGNDDTIIYENMKGEKTGYDSAKFLVELCMDKNIDLPQIFVHSANPIGSENIIKYINNFLKSQGKPETCKKNEISYYLDLDD